MLDDKYLIGPKVIFIPAKRSPIETDLCLHVLEDTIIFFDYRCIITRLGKWKEIWAGISLARHVYHL
jgi:hypothetical protein